MTSRVYLTTPIYYVNGDPHLGHAHTSVMADILKRSYVSRGTPVWLTTGTDEHGQKNEECARQAGLEPQVFLDQQAEKFKALFDRLGVGYDYFVRTSEHNHKTQVQIALNMLRDQFVKRDYTGLYCVGCEQFKKDTDLTPMGECPDHAIKPEARTESNWFFPLEPYREALLAHIDANPGWITPEQYEREVRKMLEDPLEDLCISRPKTRLQLGIELPFDNDYVAYVWFDALMNYLTNLGWPVVYLDTWAGAQHLIGKDILKTHCVYWPCMLLALGVPLPQGVQVHAHWLGAGKRKMAKSLGNVVDPNKVIDDLGVDALRYYLARRAPCTSDTQITEAEIHELYNLELAGGVGNLFSRAAKLCQNTFGGFPEDGLPCDQVLHDVEALFLNPLTSLSDIPSYMEGIAKAVSLVDQYFQAQAPWAQVKAGELGEASRTLRTALHAVKLILQRLSPVLPATCDRGLALLGGVSGEILPGQSLEFAGSLFPRL